MEKRWEKSKPWLKYSVLKVYLSNIAWAKFSNQVNCLNVWPGYKRKWELSGQYYQDNIKVEEKMLAQAGVRMAAIINFVAKQNK